MAALTDAELTALFERHHRMVHHWARRTAPGIDPEDVAQAALLRAWQRRHGYDPTRPTRNGRPPFPAWLKWQFRAALQQARERNVRRVGRPLTAAFADPSPTPAAGLTNAAEVEGVRDALDRLPPDAKALLVGRATGGRFTKLMPGIPRHQFARRHAAALAELRGLLVG